MKEGGGGGSDGRGRGRGGGSRRGRRRPVCGDQWDHTHTSVSIVLKSIACLFHAGLLLLRLCACCCSCVGAMLAAKWMWCGMCAQCVRACKRVPVVRGVCASINFQSAWWCVNCALSACARLANSRAYLHGCVLRSDKSCNGWGKLMFDVVDVCCGRVCARAC